MSSHLTLAPSGHPAVPHDEVWIEVEVDRTRCGAPAPAIEEQLKALEKNGLTISIAKLVAFASKHYFEAYDDHWGIGKHRARVQRAWEGIVVWRPRREIRLSDNASKLLLEERGNTREKANVSEVLAVGVGLIAATRVYQLPYRFWSPTSGNARTDYTAPRVGAGHVHLEARGRFDRQNWAAARAQVVEKFGATPSFSSHLGAIFAPRTKAQTRAKDLLLMDPEGPREVLEPDEPLRALLRHYAPFFAYQGYGAFGARLLELASSDRPAFQQYLAEGDDSLRALHRGGRAYRTSFSLGDHTFMGTAWEASAVPIPGMVEGDARYRQGAIIWAIWEPILKALLAGDLPAIAGAELGEWTVEVPGGRAAYTIFDDGTAIAWAPSQAELLELP